jgi:hypothetical protein
VSDQDDKPAETDEEIFREACARLKLCEDAESQNRVEGLLALNFRDGNQWDEEIAKSRTIEARPALTINHTNTFCRRVENQLRQQRPRIKCHPVGDGADIDTAATVNGLIRHIETLSNASVAYDTGVISAVNIGWGYWRIVGDYVDGKSFEQELKILPIRNTFTVYMDPAAVMPAGEDQRWCLISEDMTREEYKRRYPTATNCEWRTDAPGDMSLMWESKTHVRLAEYFRICEVADELYKMSDGSVKLKSELASKPILNAVGLTIIQKRKTTRCEVQWFRLNGRQVVEKRTSAVEEGPLPGQHIPVIRCEGNVLDVNGMVKRKGMVKDLMDPARMFNYWRTAQTERYALTPKAPWVAYEEVIEGHPEWTDANQRSYSVLSAKAVQGPNGETLPLPQRTQPAQVEAGMSEAAQGAEHDLMGIAGMPQENPEIQGRVISGNKYLQRRQGMADLTHFQYYDNQMLAIMWTGIILLELIPFYYDMPRMQRIIGDDGVPTMTGINQKAEEQDEQGNPVWRVKNDLTVGRYDVVMDTGPGYQTKREESAENMVELLGTPLGELVVKTGADIVLRNMDFPGADELADRALATNPAGMDKAIEGLPKQAQTIIGALQQQLQEAQSTIQQQSLEIKYHGDIEKLKDEGQTRRALITTTAKAHDTERNADSTDLNSQRDYEGWQSEVDKNVRAKIAVAHIQRDTALDVAEIKVGGELLNTHVEAAHESKAADKAIKAGQTDRTNGGSAAG